MSENKKVVRYRKPFNLNIGIIIFVVIFIYLIFNVFTYMTATHISPYEVEQGTMAANHVYRGLILREEQVYYANYTGTMNFYVKEGSKVSYNNLVCSIDENGEISNLLDNAEQKVSELDTDVLSELEESIYDFQTSYQSQNFYQVYSFKEDVASSLNEALNLNALSQLGDYTASAQAGNTFHPIAADTHGVVVYYTDGYEEVTTDSFTADMFHEASYSRVSNQNAGKIENGAPLYKLITSELWNIVLPVPQTVAKELADDDTLKLRFVKDDKTAYATYSLVNRDGQDYLILNLKNSMVRYAKDRYIEIELLLQEGTGLKIPNSSITQKEFFTVPKEYFLLGGDSQEQGILLSRVDKDGKEHTEFLTPTIYYETEEAYYIDDEDVGASDVIKKPDSSASYRIGENTAVLDGVYNINKGYAVFKQIDVLYQNEEYSIVRTGTDYGIALYDHIALDGSKMKEDDLVTQ